MNFVKISKNNFFTEHLWTTTSDNDMEVRNVFLDISKAINNLWHQGIKFILFQNVIPGELLIFLKDILKNRKQ